MADAKSHLKVQPETEPVLYPDEVVTFPNGNIHYYVNGRPHRENDLPAVINADGTLEYFHHGWLHRGGGKPARVRPNGPNEYWEMGQPHRLYGPAVKYADGTELWFHDGRELTTTEVNYWKAERDVLRRGHDRSALWDDD